MRRPRVSYLDEVSASLRNVSIGVYGFRPYRRAARTDKNLIIHDCEGKDLFDVVYSRFEILLNAKTLVEKPEEPEGDGQGDKPLKIARAYDLVKLAKDGRKIFLQLSSLRRYHMQIFSTSPVNSQIQRPTTIVPVDYFTSLPWLKNP